MRGQGIRIPALTHSSSSWRRAKSSSRDLRRREGEARHCASLRVSPLSSRTRPLSVGLLHGRFRLRSCDSAWLGASSMMSSSASVREFEFPARAFERGFFQISVWYPFKGGARAPEQLNSVNWRFPQVSRKRTLSNNVYRVRTHSAHLERFIPFLPFCTFPVPSGKPFPCKRIIFASHGLHSRSFSTKQSSLESLGRARSYASIKDNPRSLDHVSVLVPGDHL